MLRLFKNQKGANLVEYALLAALIAIASIGILQNLGNEVSNTFQRVNDDLQTANQAH